MSEYSLDEPGFKPPVTPVPAPPSSSDSTVEAPSDGRRKCIACPRRMSKKTADRHTLCVNCRGFDCDINTRCEECLEWPVEEVRLYAKYRKSLKSKDSSSKAKASVPTPPPADSRCSPQPAPRTDLHSQVDSLRATVQSLSDTISSRLNDFMSQILSQSNQLSSQPRLGPDAGEPQPGQTAGESRMFQALGAPRRTPLVPPSNITPLLQDVRAPASEQLGSAPSLPRSAPVAAPHSSAPQAPPHPPPHFEVPPPQPSTSGWVPPGPPPARSRHDSRSSSESEASEADSVVTVRDSTSSRLSDLIYEVCANSRPLVDARAPRCGFEAWFGQPEATASRQRFRLSSCCGGAVGGCC